MFYNPEHVLEACAQHFTILDPNLPFDKQKRPHERYCHAVTKTLSGGLDSPKLFNMIMNLPSPERQRKVLHRLAQIAEEYGCTLTDLRWWDISPGSDRFLVGRLQIDGRIGEVRFIWRSAEKAAIDLTNTVTPIPYAHNPEFQFAYEIQAREYEALKRSFRDWLNSSVPSSSMLLAVNA